MFVFTIEIAALNRSIFKHNLLTRSNNLKKIVISDFSLGNYFLIMYKFV